MFLALQILLATMKILSLLLHVLAIKEIPERKAYKVLKVIRAIKVYKDIKAYKVVKAIKVI